jgi:hypothetical protein
VACDVFLFETLKMISMEASSHYQLSLRIDFKVWLHILFVKCLIIRDVLDTVASVTKIKHNRS